MNENNQLLELKLKEALLEGQLLVIRDMISIIEGRSIGRVANSLIDAAEKDAERNLINSYGNSARERFLNVLKENQRFMKVREIASEISKVHGGEIDDLVTKLSRCTRNLKDAGKITMVQHGKSRKNYFWGSPKWLNANGDILDQYAFSTSSLTTSSKSTIDDIDL